MKWNSLLPLFCVCYQSVALADDSMLNYSLWPRRPEAVSNARALIQQQKLDEAMEELLPYVKEQNIGGREARSLVSQINKRRYLSRQNPHAVVYKVKSGDHLARIAANTKTPHDFIYLINGVIDPSRLTIGQQFVVAPMSLVIQIDLTEQELCVWDDDVLVAAYPMTMISSRAACGELKVSARLAYVGGQRVTAQSASYTSSDRVLKLSNGACILGEQSMVDTDGLYRLSRSDMNELALLINTGTVVRIVDHTKR